MRLAECHPDRKNRSKGLCSKCYAKSRYNSEKAAKRTREWRKNNKARAEYLDRSKWLAKYGLTVEQYDLILKKQFGKCALCNKPESIINGNGKKVSRLAVDHCHSTNRIRGLLCFRCNTAIGQVQKENLASKLISYLGAQ